MWESSRPVPARCGSAAFSARWSYAMLLRSCVFGFMLCTLLMTTAVRAEVVEMAMADGKLSLMMPADWKKKEPKVRIIEHECEIPPAANDETAGRMTIMGAGGSVDDNIKRWVSQFENPTKNETKELKIAGQKVFLVDLAGTFKDQPGPFAPAVKRENYRMLGAIIVTEKAGQYFAKFYGPKATVDANEEAFTKMIDELKVK
jgi:hypothetical protein